MSIQYNLEHLWDPRKVCRNPHKGWYLHYYDNCLGAYGDRLEEGDFLEDFPGLNHIYLRFAWSYLEPEEGKFAWEIIDRVAEKWLKHGYTAAFRITCKETGSDQCFATPEWVMAAGAEGTFLPAEDGGRCWEPDYGDPVFLEKLENLHRAFAERYDGKPWVEYVDIGSYGDWGEGHTASSSLRDWPVEVIRKHIDIHCRHYKKTTLVISDDIVGSRKAEDGSKEEILEYLLQKGIALRDDGICVKWFADRFGFSTLRSPEMFDLFWPYKPVDMELQHYHITLAEDTWKDGLPLAAAVEESHATFAGFHGYPREWLPGNEKVAAELANRLGYWYFPKVFEAPEKLKRGVGSTLKMVWENRGVAPAYHRYKLSLMLWGIDNGEVCILPLNESDNRNWMPGRIIGEAYKITVPEGLAPGRYAAGIRLLEEGGSGGQRVLELALKDEIRDEDGYCHIAEVNII